MAKVYLFLFVALVLGVAFLIIRQLEKSRTARRSKLLQTKLSPEARVELGKDFLLYTKLPDDLRDELDGLIHVFIEEKSFEACGGLEAVTLHMQRVIAAQACLLLLRTPHQYYGSLRSILLYPDAYRAPGENGAEDVRLGESWNSGTVILSWSNVLAGGRNPDDGHDVSLHEFSHQLDQDYGSADGLPDLGSSTCYKAWADAFLPAFSTLQKRTHQGKKTVLDSYGAQDPAEFFAVATETFYEKPEKLKKHYPELYSQLSAYYGVDPVTWE